MIAQTAGSGVGASLAEALVGAVGVGNVGALAHAVGSGFKIDGGLRNASKIVNEINQGQGWEFSKLGARSQVAQGLPGC